MVSESGVELGEIIFLTECGSCIKYSKILLYYT